MTRGWFETLRLYRDSAFAGASGEGEEEKEDRRPTALRARPPRGAQRSRALVLRESRMGCVVVAMRRPRRRAGDPRPATMRVSLAVWPGWQPAAPSGAMRQPWLAKERLEGWGRTWVAWPQTAGLKDQGRALAPGCAAEGMAVPLAVKDLRPPGGAFGVLDCEPLARHRQMEGQAGACLRSRRAALYDSAGAPYSVAPCTWTAGRGLGHFASQFGDHWSMRWPRMSSSWRSSPVSWLRSSCRLRIITSIVSTAA